MNCRLRTRTSRPHQARESSSLRPVRTISPRPSQVSQSEYSFFMQLAPQPSDSVKRGMYARFLRGFVPLDPFEGHLQWPRGCQTKADMLNGQATRNVRGVQRYSCQTAVLGSRDLASSVNCLVSTLVSESMFLHIHLVGRNNLHDGQSGAKI